MFWWHFFKYNERVRFLWQIKIFHGQKENSSNSHDKSTESVEVYSNDEKEDEKEQ